MESVGRVQGSASEGCVHPLTGPGARGYRVDWGMLLRVRDAMVVGCLQGLFFAYMSSWQADRGGTQVGHCIAQRSVLGCSVYLVRGRGSDSCCVA